MDMSKYRELFLSEAREHINSLSQLVVTLEQEPGNRETIDALFREAHSIKGMAATMGFNNTARLSHHLEDLLDGFRNSGDIPSVTIDYLLEGIDLLDGLLDDLLDDRPERNTEDFLTKQPVPAADREKKSPDRSIADVDDDESSKAPPEEPDTFQVLIELEKGIPAAAACGILILRELEKSGKVKASKPEMDELREEGDCEQIQAWLTSLVEKEQLKETLLNISGVANVRFIEDRRKNDRRLRRAVDRTIRVRTDLLDQFVNLTGELITHRNMLNTAGSNRNWDELNSALERAGRLIDDLHHNVLQVRLMPLQSITGRLPRIVRDLSRKSGKKVNLQLNGTDVGIDRVILEEITDPLVHLVRNAVDHGIEEEGVVTVSAGREKDLILIEVADNGKGMDPQTLRQKAVDSGVVTQAQAHSMSDRDALMLVCRPGFSTAQEVTETSGRGVGMDVVRAAIRNLGGTLNIISEVGTGTRFQMRLPLSIAIIKILLVRCAGRVLAIPITRVQRTLDLPTSEIQTSGPHRLFRLDEEEICLYSLAETLNLPQAAAGDITWAILTEVRGLRVGLQVDGFLGQRDAFIKPTGFPLNLLTGLSGATVEGDGRVTFVVDPQALLEKHQMVTNQ
ncbi:MAG: chemotaxis protein CheA [Deltaproteobacteria bacterium]|jgi:two-component system chemotaxis sensor kinase CheA|nr:chemotaxis protein CheA [Deltaproteobacteria bacterium]